MARVPISLQSIGNVIMHANEALNTAVEDVIRRQLVPGKRKVVLTISITPDVDGDTGVNLPTIEYQITGSTPAIKGVSLRGTVRGDQLLINLNDPASDRPDEDNLLDVAEQANARVMDAR